MFTQLKENLSHSKTILLNIFDILAVIQASCIMQGVHLSGKFGNVGNLGVWKKLVRERCLLPNSHLKLYMLLFVACIGVVSSDSVAAH